MIRYGEHVEQLRLEKLVRRDQFSAFQLLRIIIVVRGPEPIPIYWYWNWYWNSNWNWTTKIGLDLSKLVLHWFILVYIGFPTQPWPAFAGHAKPISIQFICLTTIFLARNQSLLYSLS